MVMCSAFGCVSRSSRQPKSGNQTQRKIHFHRFPQDVNRKLLWIKALRRVNWLPKKDSVVCSVHFLPSDYEEYESKIARLKHNVVPSVFPACLQKRKLSMDNSDNNICKVWLQENKDTKFSAGSLEVMTTSASVKAEKCDSNDDSTMKIKTECDEDVNVKEEEEPCADVKTECETLEDPLAHNCTEDFKHKCEICQKDSCSLKDHQTTHQCDTCDKQFTSANILRMHKQIHVATKEKPFKCYVCHKGFYGETSLEAHQSKHTGNPLYKCYVCNRGFAKMYSLKAHMKVHLKKPRFKCDVCNTEFRYPKQVKKHLETHAACDSQNFCNTINNKLSKILGVCAASKLNDNLNKKCDS